MLDSLLEWSQRWKLKVNKDKSKIVHFRRASDNQTDYNVIYGQNAIELVSMHRYLGLDLHDTLDFGETVKGLAKAAGRALGFVNNRYFTHDGLDYGTYKKLFDCMVTTIMDYACEIWGNKIRDCCNVV